MVRIIAEIGCNHQGDMEIAMEMIRVAAAVCGADVVKFQKRSPRDLLSDAEYAAPHPVPRNAYGDSYGAHREFLEFDLDQHHALKAECERNGVVYSTSVWDLVSARGIAALGPSYIKVPSATNQNFDLHDELCRNHRGEIHVSTGMTTREEIEAVVAHYEMRGRASDLVLYACTSGYPVDFEDICLLEINRLQEVYGHRVKAIGFSGHHRGIAADIAALTAGLLGEQRYGHGRFGFIERHFTLDRTWKGTDHAASLEPDGLRRLCRDVRNIEKALSLKESDILEVEWEQRRKLKWTGGTTVSDGAPEGR